MKKTFLIAMIYLCPIVGEAQPFSKDKKVFDSKYQELFVKQMNKEEFSKLCGINEINSKYYYIFSPITPGDYVIMTPLGDSVMVIVASNADDAWNDVTQFDLDTYCRSFNGLHRTLTNAITAGDGDLFNCSYFLQHFPAKPDYAKADTSGNFISTTLKYSKYGIETTFANGNLILFFDKSDNRQTR